MDYKPMLYAALAALTATVSIALFVFSENFAGGAAPVPQIRHWLLVQMLLLAGAILVGAIYRGVTGRDPFEKKEEA